MFDWKEIKGITVVINTKNTEWIIVETVFPCTYADKSLGNMKFKIETSAHMAVDYVNDVLLSSCPSFERPEIKIVDLKDVE